MNHEIKSNERVEITCEQCNMTVMQHPRNKRQRGVCSEKCRLNRNRAAWEKIEKERAEAREKAKEL